MTEGRAMVPEKTVPKIQTVESLSIGEHGYTEVWDLLSDKDSNLQIARNTRLFDTAIGSVCMDVQMTSAGIKVDPSPCGGVDNVRVSSTSRPAKDLLPVVEIKGMR